MRKWKWGWGWGWALAAVAMGVWGCNPPTSPTNLDPMEKWALAHAHEVCVRAEINDPNGIGMVAVGVLMPVGKQPGYAKVMPISYCNPAE